MANELTNGVFLHEELENPHLPAFYEHLTTHPGKHNPHSLPLQLYFAKKRHENELKFQSINGLQIIDRCLLEYYNIFVKNLVNIGMMTEQELAVYMKQYCDYVCELEHPKIIVFLKSHINTNFQRIQHRARNCETGTIDLGYLRSLEKQYDNYNRTLKDEHDEIQVIEIDTDLLSADQVFQTALAEIKKFM